MVREAKENAILVYDRALSETTQTFAKAWRSVCAGLQAKNEKELLKKLPAEVWSKIVDENVQQNDLLALASTCRFFRDTTGDLGKKLVTNLSEDHFLKLLKSGNVPPHSLDWFQWASDTLEFLPGFDCDDEERVEGVAYEGDLLNYAASQGSVEILRWLMEEKGWETNWRTGEWAGMGGSIEAWGYVRGKGYEFNVMASAGAAGGGCLKALKWLRDQDPPCPWDEETCSYAAGGGRLEVLKDLRGLDPPCPWGEHTCTSAVYGGHLEVLKFLRAQNPPCPWNESTCAEAASVGQLKVLKWLRAEEPPCPWSRSECREEASLNGHQHIIDWIDQQEDESDADY